MCVIYIYIQYACTFLCQLFVGDDSEAVVEAVSGIRSRDRVVQKRCSEMGAFGVRISGQAGSSSDPGEARLRGGWAAGVRLGPLGAFQRHVATTTHHACVSDIGQLLLMSVLGLFRSMLREFL